MSTRSKPTRCSPAANPRIEITPTVIEYQQLCQDLKMLREAGAESHTAAILKAVHSAAEGHRLNGVKGKGRAAQQRPRHGNRR